MPKIISRAEAKRRGLNRYFTGKPCKHGHLGDRRTRNGECHQCILVYNFLRRKITSERQKARYWSNPEKFRARANSRSAHDRQKYQKRIRRYQAAYRLKNREALRQRRRKAYWRDIQKRRAKRKSEYWKNPRKARKAAADWSKKNLAKKRATYYQGPSNPTGEKQWLRKNQAQLRNLRRLIRRLNAERYQSQNAGSSTDTSSPSSCPR
jgi:hypothetical protein